MSEDVSQVGETLEVGVKNLELVDAYVVALLVEKAVISQEEADTLEQNRLDELIMRSAHDLKNPPPVIPRENVLKARKMLGLSVEEGVTNDKSNRVAEIQSTELEMRSYLNQVRSVFPKVKGFLLCGSRMSPHKIPTMASDVDVVVILEDGMNFDPDSDEGRSLISELVSYTRANRTNSGFDVELDGFYTGDQYFAELNSDTPSTELKGKLIWGWDPSALKYIGEPLGEKSEVVVNEATQERLNSEDVNSQRRAIIYREKSKLVKVAEENTAGVTETISGHVDSVREELGFE